MINVYNGNVSVSVEQTMWSQGIDPREAHKRSPKLLELTKQAIEIGACYLRPQAIYDCYKVTSYKHNKIMLNNNQFLEGELIGNVLSKADKVVIVVCTMGDQISKFVNELFPKKPALAMAVEGMAASATELLGTKMCEIIEEMAKAEGLLTSVPLNPGMVGWTVREGQPQIFQCLDTSPIGVTLESTGLMKPLKSLSMVIGIGKNIISGGSPCDYCNLKNTCKHRAN